MSQEANDRIAGRIGDEYRARLDEHNRYRATRNLAPLTPSLGIGEQDSTNPKDRLGVLKPQLDLVPAVLDIYAAEAFRDGAKKYGPFNWRQKDVKTSIYIGAIRRHLAAWYDREDVADDSGVSHLAHAAASLAILIDALETGHLIDDRPEPGPSADVIRRLTRKQGA